MARIACIAIRRLVFYFIKKLYKKSPCVKENRQCKIHSIIHYGSKSSILVTVDDLFVSGRNWFSIPPHPIEPIQYDIIDQQQQQRKPCVTVDIVLK